LLTTDGRYFLSDGVVTTAVTPTRHATLAADGTVTSYHPPIIHYHITDKQVAATVERCGSSGHRYEEVGARLDAASSH